ncbi:YitT family protein [Holzapfeliella floricola]|nr:YitT family protein [Holzapfeliella floricola]
MKRMNLYRTLVDLFMITLGTFTYAFGIVAINIQNNLAEGGLTGITLIIRYWLGIDPAYSTIILNIPILMLGYYFLGRKAIFYTLWGTASLSAGLWVWQRTSLATAINLDHDLFISALLAGLIAGIGLGITFKFGGTSGGVDILGKILEIKKGISMGKSLLLFDLFVLLASLSYLDVKHMMYTLLVSFVFSKVVNFVQDSSYNAKGTFIVSEHYTEVAEAIKYNLDRGVTFMDAEGGYKNHKKKVIYCIVRPNELHNLKTVVHEVDESAFVSIFDVNETIGNGFSYQPLKKKYFFKKAN